MGAGACNTRIDGLLAAAQPCRSACLQVLVDWQVPALGTTALSTGYPEALHGCRWGHGACTSCVGNTTGSCQALRRPKVVQMCNTRHSPEGSTGCRLGYDDRTSDCFFVLHGSYQADLASRHAFADLAALRGLPPGDADDRREVT